MLSPIYNVSSNSWALGRIRNHMAEALSKEEVESHIQKFHNSEELNKTLCGFESKIGFEDWKTLNPATIIEMYKNLNFGEVMQVRKKCPHSSVVTGFVEPESHCRDCGEVIH